MRDTILPIVNKYDNQPKTKGETMKPETKSETKTWRMVFIYTMIFVWHLGVFKTHIKVSQIIFIN